jgi:2-polyprenyl-3-methyl-5-hydroxy-6-metoxy-1,4-benzoquinol methylase
MQNYSDKSGSYFGHARKEIAPLLPPGVGRQGQGARILEIGCGAGSTLCWLRQIGVASETIGVEIVEAAAMQARAFVDQVHCLDFERHDLPAGHGQFDVILCLDVLEHMVNPWKVVDRLVTGYLKPGGRMLVSLPNIRHYSAVLPLLFKGRWRYEDEGLLDRTHLRFFTRESAVAMLAHARLKQPICMATGFGWRSRKGALNALTGGIFSELLTYQYYLAAVKKDA